FIQSLEFPWTF
nr:immunoglobulin light chain junction region [Macaca mulatta]